MRFTRPIVIFAFAAALVLVLQTGSAWAQIGGGTPGSGECQMPPPGNSIQLSSEHSASSSTWFFASTSLRMVLSRWFSVPVNAPGVTGRRLLGLGR
jgi:hypothetical protein